MSYHWPGNVRELENTLERAVLACDGQVIHGHHLPPTLQTAEASGTTVQSLALRRHRAVREGPDPGCAEERPRQPGEGGAAAGDHGADHRVQDPQVRHRGRAVPRRAVRRGRTAADRHALISRPKRNGREPPGNRDGPVARALPRSSGYSGAPGSGRSRTSTGASAGTSGNPRLRLGWRATLERCPGRRGAPVGDRSARPSVPDDPPITDRNPDGTRRPSSRGLAGAFPRENGGACGGGGGEEPSGRRG